MYTSFSIVCTYSPCLHSIASSSCKSTGYALQVDQAELEAHDGVAPGKYTLGLGQVLHASLAHNLHTL